MFEVLTRAMLPIAGCTGGSFLRRATQVLVDPLGADVAVIARRGEGGWRLYGAFHAGAFVEDTLGHRAELSDLEAACLALAGVSDARWVAIAGEPSAIVGVVVRGEMADPLRTGLDLVARRAFAEMARARDDGFRLISEATGEVVCEWDARADEAELLSRIHPDDHARVQTFLRERAIVTRAPDGRPLRVIGGATDMSETKARAERLVVTERLASMATLAAGLAHEINNPLAYVKGNVEHVLHELRAHPSPVAVDPDLVAALDEAREGADRIRQIVDDLRVFSRPMDNPSSAVDVERVIDSALALANNEIGKRARLEKRFRHPPAVDANEAHLAYAMLSLIVNALHAMPAESADANTLRVETDVDAGGRVVVIVADTGAGIPADIIGRIFDPFFTTKAVGEGSGLGLSITHAIVTSLGGEIAVESAPGIGSTFRITLPASRQSAPDVSAASSSSGSPSV